jgi:carboxypeptidase Q
MRFRIAVVALVALMAVGGAWSMRAAPDAIDGYRPAIARIIADATSTHAAWQRLAEFTDMFPARLSGSQNLELAIQWAAEQMRRDGLESVRVDQVMVPHWVRGHESAELVEPFSGAMAMAGLGGSVGTGPSGIQAEAIVVKNYDDLDAHAAAVKGKIVVYNVVYRMDVYPHTAYREGTQYRGGGASRAAKLGAVAALVRSVGPTAHRTPHTGGMRYAEDAPQIPVAAISAEDADKLQRLQDRGIHPTVRLTMEARTLVDAESGNVIGELRGREKPDEIVVIGGHIDSWDLASGAMDDGGGVMATWEAVRVLKKLNLVPRRTIRVVLFTNEENGTRGGQGYRDRYRDQLAKHIAVLEADSGMLPLDGWGFAGSPKAREVVARIAALLASLGGTAISDDFDGSDVQPSARAGNVPALSPLVDMRSYFVIHHTPADTVDKVNPSDMSRCIAAIASMAYVIADLPEPLDRSKPATSPQPGP